MKQKKYLLFLAAVIIILIFLGVFVFLNFCNINNVCEKDGDCINTCCGCIKSNEKCPVKCLVLLIRDCGCKNSQCIVKSSFSNKKEALEFAKNDKDFIEMANKFKLDFNEKILYNAYFDEEEKCWNVSVWPENTSDLWYYIKFDNQGRIIDKGLGKGA